jgi:adenine-specific DNA-methyltransferase
MIRLVPGHGLRRQDLPYLPGLFPGDADSWEKLQRALKATIPEEAFEQMRGTVSFPFQSGEHRRVGVKVIGFRGNEVVRVVKVPHYW